MNTRRLGKQYEEKAAQYLQMQGYAVLERNYRNRHGEIDLIAYKNQMIIFVEVKYRRGASYGFPVEAVHSRKQRVIVQVAWYYLMQKGYGMNQPCRFDVISICGEQIHHVENAFEGFYL